jgi:hypothetical protein
LNEVEAVFATSQIYSGWHSLQDGVIPFGPEQEEEGGHAFAIIGYTQQGFIIQNSWGEGWGGVSINGADYPGCSIWTYADFDQNLWDAWVARLALPLESMEALMAMSTKYTSSVREGLKRYRKRRPALQFASTTSTLMMDASIPMATTTPRPMKREKLSTRLSEASRSTFCFMLMAA